MMADKHHGTFDELRAAVTATARPGDWSALSNGCHQFRCKEGPTLLWYPSTGTMQFQGGGPRAEFRSEVVAALDGGERAVLEPAGPTAPTAKAADTESKRIFIVHGHDSTSREQLELILHKLGCDPFVLQNTGGGGLTIIEALEREMGPGEGRTRFGIVLLTPDDAGYVKDKPEDVQPRARQNVVLEMGMLIASRGRSNVAILQRGHLERPSDADGILYLPFNDHVKEAVPRLVDRLIQAGFVFDVAQTTAAAT